MIEEETKPSDQVRGQNHLDHETFEAVVAAVESADSDRLQELLEPLHEADIADLIEELDRNQRRELIRVWGIDVDGAALSELEEGVRDEIIAEMGDEALAAAVQDLETDDVVYLTEDLEGPQQERILRMLDDADRVAVRQSLTYEEFSAGRLMQREVVVAPEHWSVGDAIDYMRAEDHLPESFYGLVIADPQMHPVGMVSLGRLMGSARPTRLKDIMEEDLRTLNVSQPQEDVAYIFNKYHIISAPVVDDDGRLVGLITIDDAMDVLEDEAEEDMKLLAGVGDEELNDGVLEIAKARFIWLTVNLITAILASVVIAQFTDTIESLVALAVLMPIVASMGGNAGTQTLTVAVRALATHSLTPRNIRRFIGREGLVGLINGVGFAVLIGVLSAVFYSNWALGAVIATAMIGNMVVAAFAGVMVPIALDRLKLDPALASGTFVTTITDVFGFFAFLGLAGAVLL
ncbi:magnesium transporter [Amaricoccus tamworthensis]|uniref:magnesium transporter n=1 Tax=Amaricoccus tamworthensis TaxID=57002 RepID=UPI003C7B1238